MILTDGSVIVSDLNVEELMEYGKKIGLNVKWIQYAGDFIHFDLLTGSTRRAVQLDPDVKKFNRTELIQALQVCKPGKIHIKKPFKSKA